MLVGVVGGLASWASSANAARSVEVVYDRISLLLTGRDPYKRCFNVYFPAPELKWLAIDYSTTDRSCYGPPRHYEGYLQVSHMGEQFDEVGCDWIGLNPPTQVIRGVLFSNPSDLPRETEPNLTGYETYLYRIKFVGRESPDLRTLVNSPVGTARGYDVIILSEHTESTSRIRDVNSWESGARNSGAIRANCDNRR